MKKQIFFDEELALQELRDGKSEAELHVLEGFAHVVLLEKKISPVLQAVVNAIVAKVVISGKLPQKKRGRPVNIFEGVTSWEVAERYLELYDSGLGYADVVEKMTIEFHKEERQIMRLVQECRAAVENRMGDTADERERFRNRRKEPGRDLTPEENECISGILAMMQETTDILEAHFANEATRDYLAELDSLIVLALSQKNPTDIK